MTDSFKCAHEPKLLAEVNRFEEPNGKTLTWWKEMRWDTNKTLI